MGPWTVVGGGACGATVVYAEGAPDFPADRIWKLVESERVTMLGVSPTLVRALIPKGRPESDMSSLKAICTTGEPWNRDPYHWLFEQGRRRRDADRQLLGRHRGRRVLSHDVRHEPIKPVALGFPALGQDMDVFEPDGSPVRGEVGELVCKRPWPGMTRGIWGDDERYLDAYWRRFPGVWTHGDWASVDEDGYWYLHGRSDDTLNIAGKRIGPAELESAAVAHGAVAEAAAIGVPHDVKGEVAWIFCVLKPGPRRPRAARSRSPRPSPTSSESLQARADRVRFGPPEDPERQDRAPGRPGPRLGQRAGRSLLAGESGGPRRDRRGRGRA